MAEGARQRTRRSAASAIKTDSGPRITGEVREYRGKSGIVTYSIRVRWKGERINLRLGTELDGWNRPLAELELARNVAQIEADVWQPPAPDIPPDENDPRFHEFATVWFARHSPELDTSTRASYGHVLSRYVLPGFKDHRLSEISYEAVRDWRDRLRAEAEQLKFAGQNGVALVDRNGRPKRAFGARTINESLRLLGQILEDAVDSDNYVIQRNPVKGRRGLRVKRPGKPPREHLEADEILSLMHAADLIDQRVTYASLARGAHAREMRDQGSRWALIAEQLGCSESTAIYLSRVTPKTDAPRRCRAMIVVLALTGPRASEHTDLVWERFDHTHGRFILEDAKTSAGVREIHLSPFAHHELLLYRGSLGRTPAPDEPIFAVRGGGPGDRFNLARRLKRIAGVANEIRQAQDLAPLPARITPHTFRRTFITLSFQAGKDVVFVQSQAGHANWKTTLEIYTQQSGRSVDPQIRGLLDVLFNKPADPAAEIHERFTVQ